MLPDDGFCVNRNMSDNRHSFKCCNISTILCQCASVGTIKSIWRSVLLNRLERDGFFCYGTSCSADGRKAIARSVLNSRSSCEVRVNSLMSLMRAVALRKWKRGFFNYAEFTWFEIFKGALLKILSLLRYDAVSTGKWLWTSGRACCLFCLFGSVHGLVSQTTEIYTQYIQDVTTPNVI